MASRMIGSSPKTMPRVQSTIPGSPSIKGPRQENPHNKISEKSILPIVLDIEERSKTVYTELQYISGSIAQIKSILRLNNGCSLQRIKNALSCLTDDQLADLLDNLFVDATNEHRNIEEKATLHSDSMDVLRGSDSVKSELSDDGLHNDRTPVDKNSNRAPASDRIDDIFVSSPDTSLSQTTDNGKNGSMPALVQGSSFNSLPALLQDSSFSSLSEITQDSSFSNEPSSNISDNRPSSPGSTSISFENKDPWDQTLPLPPAEPQYVDWGDSFDCVKYEEEQRVLREIRGDPSTSDGEAEIQENLSRQRKILSADQAIEVDFPISDQNQDDVISTRSPLTGYDHELLMAGLDLPHDDDHRKVSDLSISSRDSPDEGIDSFNRLVKSLRIVIKQHADDLNSSKILNSTPSGLCDDTPSVPSALSIANLSRGSFMWIPK